MKKLMIIITLLISVNLQAAVNYVTQLRRSTVYTSQWVNRFDKNTKKGGGYFQWVSGSNTSTSAITGIIVKPLNSSEGYWERVYDGAIKVDWFGADKISHTWATAGFTQANLDSIYGTGFAQTTDNPDNTAVQKSFRVAEIPGYNYIEFSPGTYYLNESCKLPTKIYGKTGRAMFSIDGKNCYITSSNTNRYTYFSNETTDPDSADNWSRKYEIMNFNADGTGGQDFTLGTYNSQDFIAFDATVECNIHDNIIRGFRWGIKIYFGLYTQITNNMFISNDSVDVFVGNGEDKWHNGMRQSNGTYIAHNTFQPMNKAFASCWLSASSDLIYEYNDYENGQNLADTSCKWGVYFNPTGNPVVHSFTIAHTHLEGQCDSAFIGLVKIGTGIYNIDDIFLIKTDVSVVYCRSTSYPQINLTNSPVWLGRCYLLNEGSGITWNLVNNKIQGINTAANMIDTVCTDAASPVGTCGEVGCPDCPSCAGNCHTRLFDTRRKNNLTVPNLNRVRCTPPIING